MNYLFYLLVKTECFPDRVKESTARLKSYWMEYADYTCSILEALGKFRIRDIEKCILGQEHYAFNDAFNRAKNNEFIFCNKNANSVTESVLADILNNPWNYAIVIVHCSH